MGRYSTIAITKEQKTKLDLIKGKLSYSKLLDQGFFKKVDKTDQLLRLLGNQDKIVEMLNRLAKEFSNMSRIVSFKAGGEVEKFEFKPEEWRLEEVKPEQKQEPKDYSKFPGIKRANEL